jgi:hypothetical protein
MNGEHRGQTTDRQWWAEVLGSTRRMARGVGAPTGPTTIEFRARTKPRASAVGLYVTGHISYTVQMPGPSQTVSHGLRTYRPNLLPRMAGPMGSSSISRERRSDLASGSHPEVKQSCLLISR